MPAWSYAERSRRESRAGHLAQNSGSGPDRSLADQILDRELDRMFARYLFDKRHCFFCGGTAHHTGYVPDRGPIWLCKQDCQERYTRLLSDLGKRLVK